MLQYKQVRQVLKNDNGDLPWQTIEWPFGIAYFCLLPAGVLARDGPQMAVAGFATGFVFLSLLALFVWKWPV